ncbi:hypothetical protein ACK31S_20300, partial [Aeromonas caviae]
MFDSKLKKELAAERERALKSEALDHAMHDHLPMIEFTTDGLYRSSYHLTPASNRCLVYATLVRTS